jgi:hypothetical protein
VQLSNDAEFEIVLRHRVADVISDITGLASTGEPVIFVDEEQMRSKLPRTCRTIPFTELNGEYGGRPADDVAAINEFARLHKSGAMFIAFAWPAFWWLDCYAGFAGYLRSRFRCVLRNDRLVVFELTSG